MLNPKKAENCLTNRARCYFFYIMGKAISPRGVMLKNRVPFKCKDTACLSFPAIFGASLARSGVRGTIVRTAPRPIPASTPQGLFAAANFAELHAGPIPVLGRRGRMRLKRATMSLGGRLAKSHR
jgi:hypothetical protein